MCVYSMVIDYQRKHINEQFPWTLPWTVPGVYPGVTPTVPPPWLVNPGEVIPGIPSGPTQADFDKLRNELEEMKTLLKAVEKFDRATGQPDCESEEKVAYLKKLAELLGVDLSDILP